VPGRHGGLRDSALLGTRIVSAWARCASDAPAYVKPCVKRGKNDEVDAEAICEAVTRPTMRFVPIKTAEQQSILMLHRTRDLLVRQRTMLVNSLRGQLAKFGLIAPQGIWRIPELQALAHDTESSVLPDPRELGPN
jgi:transposase